jgi:cytochrome c oxidase subunit 2
MPVSALLMRNLWLLPRGASLYAPTIDALLTTSLAILLAFFLLGQVLLITGLLLPARAASRLRPAHRWVLLAALVAVFVWMTVRAERLWMEAYMAPSAPDALHVEVTGAQFQWYFRYAGPDGVFGRTRLELADAAAGNPLGVDPADPHGADDLVRSVLVLPVNRPVVLHLRSLDVIHGFFAPNLRVKMNAVPGRMTELHVTPTVTGEYPIVCSQVCGLGHYRMHAVLRVVPQQEFVRWMAQQEAQQRAETEQP